MIVGFHRRYDIQGAKAKNRLLPLGYKYFVIDKLNLQKKPPEWGCGHILGQF